MLPHALRWVVPGCCLLRIADLARFLPLYYVNEALRAAMIFADSAGTLRCAGILGAFAAVAFVAGTIMTRWGE